MIKVHIPMRMCVACRQMKPKSELVRLVKNGGAIEIDKTGKKQCRGVYMCADGECVRLGMKKKSLERSFKCAVDKSVYELIEKDGGTDG